MSAKTTQKGQKRQTNGKTTIRERRIGPCVYHHESVRYPEQTVGGYAGDRKAVSGSDPSGINGIGDDRI